MDKLWNIEQELNSIQLELYFTEEWMISLVLKYDAQL